MKKSLLLVLAVPALLLASCGGNGGADVKPYIDSGTSITEQTKADVQAVPETKKQEAETIVNKGFTAKGRTLVDATNVSGNVTSSEKVDLNLDMTFGVTNPSVSVKFSGNVSANAYGQSASGTAEGLSEAKLVGEAWQISSDYLTLTLNGQQQRRDNYLFSGSSSSAESYYESTIEQVYSWDFDFDFAQVQAFAKQYGMADLLDNIAISGDPKTGTFEIGLTQEYHANFVGGTLKFNKFRFAYKDFLVQEYTFRLEASSSAQSYSTSIVMENDYVFTYNQ